MQYLSKKRAESDPKALIAAALCKVALSSANILTLKLHAWTTFFLSFLFNRLPSFPAPLVIFDPRDALVLFIKACIEYKVIAFETIPRTDPKKPTAFNFASKKSTFRLGFIIIKSICCAGL